MSQHSEHAAPVATTERYVRVNITRNTKGYSYETTVSVRTTEDDPIFDMDLALRNLNTLADQTAREEIRSREREDGREGRENG